MRYKPLPRALRADARNTQRPYLYQLLEEEQQEERERDLIDPETSLYRDRCLERIRTCPVCGGDALSRPFVSVFAYAFCECRSCRSIFRNPRLRPEIHADLLEHSALARSWARRAATNFNPDSRSHEAIFSRLEVLLGNKTPRLCDIGARCGQLVHQAARRGWEAWGVEPSREACDFMKGQGLRVKNALFSRELFAPESLDVITMEHVMLNLYEPRRLFGDIAAGLAPGGVLLFKDFNRDSLGFRVNGRGYRALMGRNAILVASRRGIEALLAEAGLALLEYATEGMDVLPEDYAVWMRGTSCLFGLGRHRLGQSGLPFDDDGRWTGLWDGLQSLTTTLDMGAYYTVLARKGEQGA